MAAGDIMGSIASHFHCMHIRRSLRMQTGLVLLEPRSRVEGYLHQ